MAKGKSTYVAYYSTISGKMVHTTYFNKRNEELKGRKFPELSKYDPIAKKHVSTKEGTLKAKVIKN